MRVALQILVLAFITTLTRGTTAASPLDRAHQLVRERATIRVKIQINAPDTASRGASDQNASSTVTSQGSEHCADNMGATTCTTGTSTSVQGGGISPSAQARISRATEENTRLNGRLTAIEAELATIDPAIVQQAAADVAREDDGNPLDAVGAVPKFFLALPGPGSVFIGGQAYAGVRGSGGGGFTVLAQMTKIVMAGMIGGIVEIGGYKNGGAAGWFGVDLGFGVPFADHGRRDWHGYVGLGWSIRYGGIVSTRRYAPAIVVFGYRAGKFGLALEGGAGWRYVGDDAHGPYQPDPSDPAVDATYHLPLGFEAYHARLLLNLGPVQLGASYMDMDGLKTASVLFGSGGIAVSNPAPR